MNVAFDDCTCLECCYARKHPQIPHRSPVMSDAISEAFEAARATVAELEAERDERSVWESAWRPSDRQMEVGR